MSVPQPDHSHATLTSKIDEGNEIARQLRTIKTAKKRLTAEQVNHIREAILCDGRTAPSVAQDIYPPISVSTVHSVVRGVTYRTVPLTRRLKIAYRQALEKRKVPVHHENLLEDPPE